MPIAGRAGGDRQHRNAAQLHRLDTILYDRSLAGKYPRIPEDEVVGEEAKRLFKDANDMLDKLSAEKALNPRGVVGLFPANRVGTTSKFIAMRRALTC